jgi:hypothetical protein
VDRDPPCLRRRNVRSVRQRESPSTTKRLQSHYVSDTVWESFSSGSILLSQQRMYFCVVLFALCGSNNAAPGYIVIYCTSAVSLSYTLACVLSKRGSGASGVCLRGHWNSFGRSKDNELMESRWWWWWWWYSRESAASHHVRENCVEDSDCGVAGRQLASHPGSADPNP